MKKLCLLLVFLASLCFLSFGETTEPEEIDFLLFSPNSGNEFVNQDQAMIQLDNVAAYLLKRNLVPNQIFVYGYAAVAENDIEPVKLSRDRALFVVNELHKRGIPRDMFSDPVAYGEVDLWGGNTNEEDRSPNRRVRILLDGKVLTPVTIKAAETGIKTPVVTAKEEAVPPKKLKGESNSQLLWKFLIPVLILLLLLALILFLLGRKRKSKPIEVKEITPTVPPVHPAPPVLPVPPAPKPAEVKKTEEPVMPAPVVVPMKKSVSIVNIEEEIRRRAYELSEQRNGQNGDMDGDWYIALPEIRSKYEAEGYQVYDENGSWWARKTITTKQT